jgi:hypothetical protein
MDAGVLPYRRASCIDRSIVEPESLQRDVGGETQVPLFSLRKIEDFSVILEVL